MNNVQDVLQLIMKTDIRLLACIAGLLIVLLFWRVFHRTTRIDREIARLNERFERIREEVRSLGRKPLLAAVPPAGGEPAAVGTAEENPVMDETSAEDNFFFTADTEETQTAAVEEPFDPFKTESFSFSSEGVEGSEERSEEPGFEEPAAEPDLTEEETAESSWMESSALETAAGSEEAPAEMGIEEPAAEPDLTEEEPAENSWMETFSTGPSAPEGEETPAGSDFEETAAEADQPEKESIEDSWMGTFSAEPAAEGPEETSVEPGSEETAAEPDDSDEESIPGPWMKPAPSGTAFAGYEEPPAESGTEEPAVEEQAEPAAGSDIIRLGDDPNRPDIRLARCLACNYKLAYPGKLSGKRIRCPSCKSEHVLP